MSAKRIRVLVIDDDPWSQQVISSQLVQSGFRVDSAGDGWEGLILAGHGQPDLIVMEVHLPTTDAWLLADSLRNQPLLAGVPIIFMADESPGLKPGASFRQGVDQLLTKPFTIVDLRAVVDQALGRGRDRSDYSGSTKIIVEVPSGANSVSEFAEQPQFLPSGSWEMPGLEPALRGSLASFGLSSLLMVIELERMSGLLVLHSPSGSGRAAIRQGRVTRSRIDGDQGARDAHAIYEMLQWSSGTFEFRAGAVHGDDQIGMSTSFLLMEGARLADERAYLNKKL